MDVSFREGAPGASDLTEAEHETDLDAPDAIVDGRVDLGALTAEFLAIGLDPYPKKPGIVFTGGDEDVVSSPFASLATLRRPGE